jgi:hypothetical protein
MEWRKAKKENEMRNVESRENRIMKWFKQQNDSSAEKSLLSTDESEG